MSYTPTQWINETPGGVPLRYKITDADGSVIADGALIELLTVLTPGTPVNAANLNKMERGIADAHGLVAAAQSTANAAQTKAATAQSSANTAATNAAAANTAATNAAAAAATAQASANAANTLANTAKNAATAAQTTANTANTAAATAQTTANAAVPKSTATAKGDILVATGAGAITRLAAGANGQTIVYDSTQPSGVRVGTVVSELSLASLGSEASSSSQTWADVLTANVTLARSGRIRVRAYGQFRGSGMYVAPAVRLVIDGTADSFEQWFQINTDPPDASWRPWSLEWFRAGIASGARTVKLQLRNGYTSGTAYLSAGARLVIEVDYP